MNLSHVCEAVEIGPWSYLLGTGDNGLLCDSADADWPISKLKLGRQLEPQLEEKGDSVFARLSPALTC